MAGLVALAIILLAAVQVQSYADRDDVNEVRLNDLHGKLDELEHILDERAKTRDERFRHFNELRARVHSLEAKTCGKREFHCEGSAVHCIHDMLVCDGANDCDDGSDEKHCENPAHAGASFEGTEFNHQCETSMHSKKMQIDIIGEKRFNDFPSLSILEVKLTLDDREEMFRGVYSYGQKALVVKQSDGRGYGLICYFDSDHSKFCHAKIVSILSGKVCSEAIMTSK